jgi:hypothetical protein
MKEDFKIFLNRLYLVPSWDLWVYDERRLKIFLNRLYLVPSWGLWVYDERRLKNFLIKYV